MPGWIFTTIALAAAPLPGPDIHVVFRPFPHAATEAAVRAFAARSAEPVTAYYGRFPVKKLLLEVRPNARDPLGIFGKEFHGTRVELFLGAKTSAADLRGNGMLTHEMFHLGFPDLAREHAWIEEGLATYLAHLARARSGQTSETEFWNDLKEGFEDSLPKNGDGGLAEAENYRRIYWGGALFWLEIDLEIRDRSAGKRSLDTVTRAILAAGGTNAHPWTLPRLRRAVDRYAGFPVFQKWYDFFGVHPGKADLPALWRRLGLVPKGHGLEPSGPNEMRAAILRNLP